MGFWKIHEHVDLPHGEEPIDVTGVVSCQWCESIEAKCIQALCLLAFIGLCIGLGILALLNGELYFCMMLLFAGCFPILLMMLFLICMRIQKVKLSRRNSVKISSVEDDEQISDNLISSGKPNFDKDSYLEVQSQLQLSDSASLSDSPPGYDEAISVSASNTDRADIRRSSLQITTV